MHAAMPPVSNSHIFDARLPPTSLAAHADAEMAIEQERRRASRRSSPTAIRGMLFLPHGRCLTSCHE